MAKGSATAAITEAEFGRVIEDALTLFNWRWTHFRPAQTKQGWRTPLSGHAGFPDYFACRAEALICVELKSKRGRLSPEQQEWRDALLKAGVAAYVWYPSDIDEAIGLLR